MWEERFRLLWDVFLSFRGKDTRDFTDYVKDSLESIGLRVFRDNDGLNWGDEIAPTLSEAIEDSYAFVVILSPNYADSPWCLCELAEICDCADGSSGRIRPVFYGVRPSDVREQKGPFEDAFRTYEAHEVHRAEVPRWRNAMRKVGGVAGYVFKDIGDANELRSMVQKISERLGSIPVGVAQYTVGLDDRVKKVMKLLKLRLQPNGVVRVLKLCGMSGVGKTALAKALFRSLIGHFGCRSFVANVRQASSKGNGLISLQNRIISDLSPGAVVRINNVNVGISAIRRIVRENRVLIVLDDVVDIKQVESLIGKRESFCEGSLIIITTRSGRVLHECHVDLLYEVEILNSSEARKLLSYHALRRKQPREKFFAKSERIVSVTGTLPLALEVFGSFLFDKRKVEEWDVALGQLHHICPGRLQDVLEIIFNGLEEEERCAFVNIANSLLPMGITRDNMINVLRCYGFRGETVITALIEKCLIKICEDNMIWMHDEIRDFGTQIVLADKDMLSRLWDPAEILAFLKGEKKDIAGTIYFVDDINPQKIDWKIKVRVIRMWTVPEMNPEKTRSVEMVLMDERGGRIHATIKGTLINSFKSLLKEGVIYQMDNFEVNHNNGKYRTSRHKFKLSFTQQTIVKESEHEIPREGFLFTPFAETGMLKDETFLIDVIGKVVGKGSEIEKQSEGKGLMIELENPEGNKLKCVLWGKDADEMRSSLKKEEPIIVIIQFGTVKVLKDGVEISNEYFGTKLLVNPTVKAATEYRNKIEKGYRRSSQISRRLNSENLMNVETTRIDEILKTPQPVSRVTLARITEIETRDSWWYTGCETCRTKVKQCGAKFFCGKCDSFILSTIAGFRVKVKVKDGTRSTSLTILDPGATEILGKTATAIRERIIREGVQHIYPSELHELRDKIFLFLVNIKKNQRCCSVLKMINENDDERIGTLTPTAANQLREIKRKRKRYRPHG